MNAPVQLSALLVTRNRPASLQRCLASLREQSVQPFEIIVSDDSSPEFVDPTREVATRFQCRYLPGPRRGLYANRNAAFSAALGTHFRTVDDDHTFPPGHIFRCLAAIESDPHAIWTTGERSFFNGRTVTTPTATQLHPAGVGGPILDLDDNWAIADGSTCYPRTPFDLGLKMVENFGFGATYLEFGAYLYRHGFRSRCIPDCLVEHHVEESGTARDLTGSSRVFASICFNRYFRPSPLRLVRHLLRQYLAKPSLIAEHHSLSLLAKTRWATLPRESQAEVSWPVL